jgi:hypothetical protein
MQFSAVTLVNLVRLIPTPVFVPPLPLMVYPAQLRVMWLTPITSPFPEQGPMLPVRTTVVPGGSVIVAPHAGDRWTVLAKTAGGKKINAQPRKVNRSRTVSRIFGEPLGLKTDSLTPC